MITVTGGNRALTGARDALLQRLITTGVASRLGARDCTLWGEAAEAEAKVRLDWVHAAEAAAAIIDAAEALRAQLAARGVDRIVLCGMGGSSLAPEVICQRYGATLEVLDSTHPNQVSRTLETDLTRTAVVVSSKSGSTIETRSHLALFEAAFLAADIAPAERLVIVTDPDSALEQTAQDHGYRVFRANPRVGGRFSALTAYGIVPAVLAGANLRGVVSEALAAHPQLVRDCATNPALQLAAAIAAGLPERYALVLRECEPQPTGISAWIEQLVAESTGKQGKGVLPVTAGAHSPEAHRAVAPDTTTTVHLRLHADTPTACAHTGASGFQLSITAPLGAQLLLWEFATAILGHCLELDPFNQPDVESAKIAARTALAAPDTADSPHPRDHATTALAVLRDCPGTAVLAAHNFAAAAPADLAAVKRALSAALHGGGYLAIQAYLDRGDTELTAELHRLRDRIADQLNVPATLGWGPRFLHSTGQLHKGGPELGVFLQLQDTPRRDIDVVTMQLSLKRLLAAQALGDREVLAARGRPVLALRVTGAAEISRLFSTAAHATDTGS